MNHYFILQLRFKLKEIISLLGADTEDVIDDGWHVDVVDVSSWENIRLIRCYR